jgi:hypothetical protein
MKYLFIFQYVNLLKIGLKKLITQKTSYTIPKNGQVSMADLFYNSKQERKRFLFI